MLQIFALSLLFTFGWAVPVIPDRYIPPERLTNYIYSPRPDETPKPYEFSYVAEAIGGQSTRKESADGSGRVVGSYTVSDEDGRSRVVEYVADEAGFRAVVNTNEPGTKSDSPANVEFYSTFEEPPHPVRVQERPRPVVVPETPQPVREVTTRPVRPYYRPRQYLTRRRPYYGAASNPHYDSALTGDYIYGN